MLDLYKDEPKKIFKIMDVIIDQDIDPNMKKPLHLWYYQDKAKQGIVDVKINYKFILSKISYLVMIFFCTRRTFESDHREADEKTQTVESSSLYDVVRSTGRSTVPKTNTLYGATGRPNCQTVYVRSSAYL